MSFDGSLKFDTKLDTKGFEQGTGRMGDIVKGLSVFSILQKGFSMVQDSIQAAFNRIDSMERFERVMTVMTGSTELSNKALSRTKEIVVGTAYGLDIGAKAVQVFVAKGMDVDKATTAFANWGDAVAFYGDGTNSTLTSVTEALAKMQTKGNVTMEHMQMLFNAGIPAVDIYADAVGKSTNEVTKMMSEGKLKTVDFMNVMDTALTNGSSKFPSVANAAKEAGASWAGTFDNMKAAITRGTQSIIEGLESTLKSMNKPTMREGIANFGKTFEKTLKTIAKAIGETIKILDKLSPLIISVGAAFLTWKATTVIAGMVAGFKALSTSVRAYTIRQIEAAVANKADAAAISIKTILTAALTGKITVATAAQALFNKVLAANPIGLAVVAIGALVTALGFLINKTGSYTNAAKQQSEANKEVIESSKAVSEEIRKSAEDHEVNMQSAENSAKKYSELSEKIFEMKDAIDSGAISEEHSNAAKRELSQRVGDLNKQVKDLNLSYDAETNTLNMSNESVKSAINLQKELTKEKLQQARQVKIIEEIIKAEDERYRIENQLYQIEEKRKEAQEYMGNILKKNKINIFDAGNAARITKKEHDELKNKYDELGNQIEINNKLYDEKAEKAVTDQEMTEEQRLAMQRLAEQYGLTGEQLQQHLTATNTSMDEWQIKMKEATEANQKQMEGYAEKATNMFDKIDVKSKVSIDSLIGNLNHNSKVTSQWADNLKLAADRGLDKGLIQQLKDAGPESAKAVESIVNSSDAKIQELNTSFKNCGSSSTAALVNAFNGTGINPGAEMVSSVAVKIQESSQIQEAAGAKATEAKEAMSSKVTESDFGSIGVQIGNDIVTGVQSVDTSTITTGICNSILSGMQSIVGNMAGLTNEISAIFVGMGANITGIINTTMSGVNANISAMSASIKSSLSGLSTSAMASFLLMSTTVVSSVSGMSSLVTNAFVNMASVLSGAATNVSNGVIESFRSMETRGVNIINYMFDGMLIAMNNRAPQLYGKAREIAKNIASTMERALDINSPSRVTKRIGSSVMEGLMVGLEDDEDALYSKLEDISDNFSSKLKNLSKESVIELNRKMMLSIDSSNLNLTRPTPQSATSNVRAQGKTHVTNFTQNIYSHDALSPSEISQQSLNAQKRLNWQIP